MRPRALALFFSRLYSPANASDERPLAASKGAVISRWLGSLCGAVVISENVSDLDALGPASLVVLLTVNYGYFLKAVI